MLQHNRTPRSTPFLDKELQSQKGQDGEDPEEDQQGRHVRPPESLCSSMSIVLSSRRTLTSMETKQAENSRGRNLKRITSAKPTSPEQNTNLYIHSVTMFLEL